MPDQKDSKQPDAKDAPKALEGLQKDLRLVASDGFYHGGPGVLARVVQTPLLAAAATHLTGLTDEKKGSLGKDKLTELVKEPRAAVGGEEKKLELVFGVAQRDALVNAAVAHLTAIKNQAKDATGLLAKLFVEPPPADFEQQWNKLFNDQLEGFKADVSAKRAAIEAKAAELIRGLAPPDEAKKAEIEKYKAEQLKSLTDLETHFKTELEKQRDTAIFEAMAKCKFEDDQALRGGVQVGKVSLLKPGERTLHDHVNTLALDPDLEARLFQIVRTSHGLLSWDDRERADFETKGILPGVYEAGASQSTREQLQSDSRLIRMWGEFWHWSQKSKFTVTDEGVKFKTGDISAFGSVGTFDTMLSVARARKPEKDQLDLSIWGDFGFDGVSKLADAISLRGEKIPPALPTMKLTDKSIYSLLDEGVFFKKSIKDIAILSLKLQGKEPPDKKDQPQGVGKLDQAGYDKALREEEARIKGLSANRELQQRGAASSHEKEAGAGGGESAEPGKSATARRKS